MHVTQEQYELAELIRASNDAQALSKQTLEDRKAAQESYADTLKYDHPKITRTLEYIIAGHYGYAQMVRVHKILSNPRLNRVAGLGQEVALWEHGCPDVHARKAWLSLTPNQRAACDRVIKDIIDRWDSGEFKDEE